MILQSKYDLNQEVYVIQKDHKQEWIKCPACGGNGHVTLLNGDRTCPECYGRAGHYVNRQLEWQVKGMLTIGQIRHEITNIEPDDIFDNVGHYKEGNTKTKVQYMQYMAYETGVGSGTLYYEDKLFPTLDDAEIECNKLNLESKDE